MNKNGRVDENGLAKAGSQRQIQTWVNEHPDELTRRMLDALPLLKQQTPNIRWVSPLRQEHYGEYYDQDFLRVIEHPELAEALNVFWPRSGPRWDALATIEFPNGPTRKGVVLVEAKSHRIEMFSRGCGAGGQSLKAIQASLKDTRRGLGVKEALYIEDKWIGPLYQYTNRLAYLHFFNEVAKVPAWLVNIYFLNDPYRPTSQVQWEDFLPDVKMELLGRCGVSHPQATDLYLEAKP